MKQLFFPFLVLFVALCSFQSGVRKPLDGSKYFIYTGGTERVRLHYFTTSVRPAECPGSATLCWFYVFDSNQDNVISDQEFYDAFDAVDQNNNGLLDDDPEIDNMGIFQILEKKG